MLTVSLILTLVGEVAPQPSRTYSHPIKTASALNERFEVVSRFSFTANRLGDSFTLGANGDLLYFTEGRSSENVFDLMAVPLGGRTPYPVKPLSGPESPLKEDESGNETYFQIESVPGDPGRLVVARGEVDRCCRTLALLNLTTGKATAMDIGQSPRHAFLEQHGESPGLKAALRSASPSGKYLLAELWLQSRVFDDQHFAIFSLETGRREFLYSIPIKTVPQEEYGVGPGDARAVYQREQAVGLWDSWWEPTDVLVLRQRGGSGEKVIKVEAFERDETGEWHAIPPPSKERRKSWSIAARHEVGDYATIFADANGQKGFVVDGSLLFAPGPGGIWLLEVKDKAVVIKVHSRGIEGRVEVVVLKGRPSPAVQ